MKNKSNFLQKNVRAVCIILVFCTLTGFSEDSVIFEIHENRLPMTCDDGQDEIALRLNVVQPPLNDFEFEVCSLFIENSVMFTTCIPFSDSGKMGIHGGKLKDVIIPAIYDEIFFPFSRSLEYFQARNNETFFLLHRLGHRISEEGFEKIYSFSSGRAIVKCNGKIGIMDARGNWLISPRFDETDTIFREGILAFSENKKWGYIRFDGTELLPAIYDGATGFSEGLAIVQRGNKCALIRNDMTLITDFLFDYAFRPSDGMVAVSKDGKWGYINDVGEMVIPCEYDFALRFRQGIGYILKDKECFLIYRDGTLGNEPLFSDSSEK